ncbi:putative kinase involved in propanediol utilizat ion [Novosphingobium sp. PY1]|nr:putative kinase involved in propanediol utilizat ion [Novosphingobium sp. PY1]
MGAVRMPVPAPALEPGREVARARLAFADQGHQGRWLGHSVPFARLVKVRTVNVRHFNVRPVNVARRRILRLTRLSIRRIRSVVAVPKRHTAAL